MDVDPSARPTEPDPSRLSRWVPPAWAVVLTVLMLGPALLPGYVLIRDMVWVPNLTLRADVLGLGTAVPRAVPSDAVVAVLDQITGGMVLQKTMLAGSLIAAGIGFARLAPAHLGARLVAVTIVIWNPYIAERLAIGHWPMVVCVAVLPWLVLAGRRFAETGRFGPGVVLLVALGSLNANAGLASSLVLLAFGWRKSVRWLALAACCVVAQLPWLISGLVHSSQAGSAGGYDVFAANSDGLPLPLAALGLGGIWNADVIPDSRGTALAWVGLALLVALLAAGARRTWARCGRGFVVPAFGLWLIGWGIAVAGWAAPQMLAELGRVVPGAGALRDSARMLVLCLPLIVVVCAHGAQVMLERLTTTVPRIAVACSLVIMPVMVMPDVAMGVEGELRAVHYPTSWTGLRPWLDAGHGDAVYLPLSTFRRPAFNAGRPVTDPLARLLKPVPVVDDDLVVDLDSGPGQQIVTGEDPRVPAVREALRSPTPQSRAAALGRLGIGWVLIHQSPTQVPSIAGTHTRSGDLRVVRLDAVSPPPRVTGVDRAWVIGGWVGYVGAVIVSIVGLMISVVADLRRKR